MTPRIGGNVFTDSNSTPCVSAPVKRHAPHAARPLEPRRRELVADLATLALKRLASAAAEARAKSETKDVDALCEALLSSDAGAGAAYAQRLLAQGISRDEVIARTLPAAAIELGRHWDEDALSLFDVTLASVRLQGLLRQISEGNKAPLTEGASVIVATTPGDDHSFGARVAAERLRAHGWRVTLLMGLSQDEIMSRVATAEADAVALSAAGEHAARALEALITRLRQGRPDLPILVCGQIVAHCPDAAAVALADGAAADFNHAEMLLLRLAKADA